MSWLYSRALVEAFSEGTCSDGEPSAPSSGSPTPQAYLSPDKMKAFSRLSRFGMTFAPLTDDLGEAVLTSFLEDFPVRTLALQAKGKDSPASEADSGGKWLASFAKYDRATSSWKIPQCSLLGDSTAFSGTWPKQGMMRRGGCSAQPTLEPLISESASGSLLPTRRWQTINGDVRWPMIPTPTAMDHRDMSVEAVDYARTNSQQVRLAGFVRTMIPTPTVGDSQSSGSRNAPGSKAHAGVSLTDFVRGDRGKGRGGGAKGDGLPHAAGGSLNPTWVEWLMGWPLGWTDLKPLEMGKWHSWLLQHGNSF